MFLDVDDVFCLNRPYGGYDVASPSPPADLWKELFHAPAVALLCEVALKFNPRFVLTTSWLRIMELGTLESVLRKCGLGPVADRLHPQGEVVGNRGQSRHAAIAAWLAKHHKGEPFVVLDDKLSGTGLQGADFDLAGRLVLCDVEVGLLPRHMPVIERALTTTPGKTLESCDGGASPYAGQQLLYLGISGTLHPSQSAYELVMGRNPWEDGHHTYEAVPWLVNALERWPAVCIVLTSAKASKSGFEQTLSEIGPELGSRVIGATFVDLTTRVLRARPGKAGPVMRPRFSVDDYWRMNKSEVVRQHVSWGQPAAWVILDDEDIDWKEGDMPHLVMTDSCSGLLQAQAQATFLSVCAENFGPGVAD